MEAAPDQSRDSRRQAGSKLKAPVPTPRASKNNPNLHILWITTPEDHPLRTLFHPENCLSNV